MIDMLNKMNITLDIKEPHYYYNSNPIPRVTEILSFIDNDYLIGWANHLGFKHQSYKEVLSNAANIGTETHSNIEKFLKKEDLEYGENIPYKSFLLWWNPLVSQNVVEILGQEESLSCEWFGGTYDLLIKLNGRIFLVDFKTSNHVSYKYFMQLAAYRHMLYKSKGINIDGCIILQLNKVVPSFKEYFLDFSYPEHYVFIENCIQSFLSLVYTYYQVTNTKKTFDQIKW